MLKVYRRENNEEYWDRRWAETGVDEKKFSNLNIYPIKFAEMVMKKNPQRVLEIGCGTGRVVRHYHAQGKNIEGVERSKVAVEAIAKAAPELKVVQGDVKNLPYKNGSFDAVMAFGVFHNLETGLEDALEETSRVLKPGGQFCISMRPLNAEMLLNEAYWKWANRKKNVGPKAFHKILVSEKEFKKSLQKVGLKTGQVFFSKNVSLLYRLPFLQKKSLTGEAERRSAGYQLNPLGAKLDKALSSAFPYQTANVMIFLGTKSHES